MRVSYIQVVGRKLASDVAELESPYGFECTTRPCTTPDTQPPGLTQFRRSPVRPWNKTSCRLFYLRASPDAHPETLEQERSYVAPPRQGDHPDHAHHRGCRGEAPARLWVRQDQGLRSLSPVR